jgi:hypothetical protein
MRVKQALGLALMTEWDLTREYDEVAWARPVQLQCSSNTHWLADLRL